MTSMSRRALLGALGAVTVGGLAACTPRPAPPQPTRSPTPTPTPTPNPVATNPVLGLGVAFTSGSSCIGAANGDFAAWRGKPSRIAATWATDGTLLTIREEYRAWQGALDYSPQYAFAGTDHPFSWPAMAAGRFDARMRKDLKALRAAWGDRTTTLNYRFQHEFNGDWYPWAVTEATTGAFVEGWRRFAGLFHEVFDGDPRFRLVWCAGGGSRPKQFTDIRSAYPGDDVVDVVSVDYYDFVKAGDAAAWKQQLNSTDGGGGPVGLAAWRSFAADHGKPLALSEWGNQYGDDPYFVAQMHDFIADQPVAEDGTASGGQLLYEIYFNERLENGTPATQGDFRVQQNRADSPLRPKAAARYRSLWGGWSLI